MFLLAKPGRMGGTQMRAAHVVSVSGLAAGGIGLFLLVRALSGYPYTMPRLATAGAIVLIVLGFGTAYRSLRRPRTRG